METLRFIRWKLMLIYCWLQYLYSAITFTWAAPCVAVLRWLPFALVPRGAGSPAVWFYLRLRLGLPHLLPFYAARSVTFSPCVYVWFPVYPTG